jgi:hypothetical protein
MTRRFMKTFMATMLELVIITLVEVNANDLATTPFHLSNHDSVRAKFANCLAEKFKICQDDHQETKVYFELDICVYNSFMYCAGKNTLTSEHLEFKDALVCLRSCMYSRPNNPLKFSLKEWFLTCYKG